jgi:hypothetical protein
MADRQLPPQVHINLQISLDKVRTLQDECRVGLTRLADGTLTKEAYRDLFRRQLEAQRHWELQHQAYLLPDA